MFVFVLPHFIYPQTESEPNDGRDQANDIRLGERITGYFQKRGNYDWFKLVISDSGKNIIRIELSGVPEVNVRLDVADESGAQLKSSNFTRKGEPESIINAGYLFYLDSMSELFNVASGFDRQKLEDRVRLHERVETWALKGIEDWLLLAGSRQEHCG